LKRNTEKNSHFNFESFLTKKIENDNSSHGEIYIFSRSKRDLLGFPLFCVKCVVEEITFSDGVSM
jgi:hypothetical protein